MWRNRSSGERNKIFPRPLIGIPPRCHWLSRRLAVKQRDVRLVGKLLISDLEFNAAHNLVANSTRQANQYMGKPFAGCTADQRHVRSAVGG